MFIENEYNNLMGEVIILRDELNYNLDDTILFLKNICDKEIITNIFNESSNYIACV
jgi:hypothetical protein